jgi:hypothetical protein
MQSTPVTMTPTTHPVANATSDVQTQMMLMLTESFSKLSTVLADKQIDTKVDWPKFSGDSKQFKVWYVAIMAQLSLAPWTELYDGSRNDVVLTTTNTSLNSKLYAKLLIALEGVALQHIVSRPHLRANGLLVLQELVHIYKPTNVPELITAKTSTFWGNTKRLSSETVDTYYNRFQELLDELQEADDPISTKSAMQHFISTSGPELKSIQNNYQVGNLPSQWHTTDWPSLLRLCRDYYNSIRPHSLGKKDSSSDPPVDRIAQQKKVREWFLNPVKFCKEIEHEQKRFPDKCIYHLPKSHPTDECNIKKECTKLLQAGKSSNGSQSSGTSTGQLRHISEEVFEDAVFVPVTEVESDSLPASTNITNEDDLQYFARLSNHYLRLANSSSSLVSDSRHPMKFPVIADSGTNFHMFKEREFFEVIHPASGHVLLGDGHTTLNIQGVGTVKCYVGNHVLTITEVRCIPDLAESIYSLFQHIKCPGHGLHLNSTDGLFLTFLGFQTKTIIGTDDIYLDARPISDIITQSNDLPVIDAPCMDTFCRDIKNFQENITSETKTLDKILSSLREYYKEVKTRQQLGLDVPAGSVQLKKITNPLLLLGKVCQQMNLQVKYDDISSSHSMRPTLPVTHQVADSSHTPIIRCVDKPSTSLPNTMSFSEDFLCASVGF